MGWLDTWSNPPPERWLDEQRLGMVETQIVARGVRNPRVLDALRRVPRHRFVPPALIAQAYDDKPLGIGEEQTISQPYIVARMTELAAPAPTDRVLEIGTGSGYQTAVLAELAGKVYTIERLRPLLERAQQTLRTLGYDNVAYRLGDGYLGWPEEAPFDAIVVTAAPTHVPEALRQQLADGGRLVTPVGEHHHQELMTIIRRGSRYEERVEFPVRFVPLVAGLPE